MSVKERSEGAAMMVISFCIAGALYVAVGLVGFVLLFELVSK